MKHKITLLLSAVLLYAASLSSCRSAHALQAASKGSPGSVSKCDQAIRYYSQKIIAKGESIAANTEVVIDMSAKLINLKSESPNGEKDAFDTIIETYDCTLNSSLTEGKATYTGYIKQLDGSTTRAVVKVETKDGGLIISNGEPGMEDALMIIVSRWELVSE